VCANTADNQHVAAFVVTKLDAGDTFDFAAACSGTRSEVDFAFGDGQLGFQAAKTWPAVLVDPQVNDLVVADFDGDMQLDIATASDPSDRISAAFGPTFARTAGPDTGGNHHALATGSFDGNGAIDLVVTSTTPGTDPATNPTGAKIFFNTSMEQFTDSQARTISPSDAPSYNPRSVRVGAFRDGTTPTDVALLSPRDVRFNWAVSASSTPLTTSDTVVSLSATDSASDFQLADLDGDGLPDLVVAATASSGNTLQVALNKGSGKFDPLEVVGMLVDPSKKALVGDSLLAVGDVDGDGQPEVVVVHNSGVVVVFHNGP
jgi:hypothetical protein